MTEKWRILYHSARADFRERVRRYSFFMTLLLTAYASYLYLPPRNANYLTVAVGGCRGIYNSAYVGGIMAVLCSIELSLVGFFLVKGTTDRDMKTGVGQIIAAAPLSRLDYILGKVLSNYLLLSVMVVVIALMSVAMQLVRSEVTEVRLWALLSPFIFVVLPTMALVAAIALLFESIALTSRTIGNIVYLTIWTFALVVTANSFQYMTTPAHTWVASFWHRTVTDPFGIAPIMSSITIAAKSQCGAGSGLNIGFTDIHGLPKTFAWGGMQWPTEALLGRVFWLGVALGLASFASLFFHRFDAFAEKRRLRSRRQHDQTDNNSTLLARSQRPSIHLTPLSSRDSHMLQQPARMLVAELRLMLKGIRWWWYVAARWWLLVW